MIDNDPATNDVVRRRVPVEGVANRAGERMAQTNAGDGWR
jgi:hypothetical protein